MISAVLHVAINVTDLNASAKFYGDLLELPRCDRPLSFPGLWYQVGAVQIHLIVAEQMTHDLVDTERWGRNSHIAFAVNDLETIKAKLLDAGYSIQESASGRSAFWEHPNLSLGINTQRECAIKICTSKA